jgi:subtilisin family serine protease
LSCTEPPLYQGSIGDFIAQRASLSELASAGVSTGEYIWQPAYAQIRLDAVSAEHCGDGVKVAVLDTGANPLHCSLYGRCAQGFDALNGTDSSDEILDGVTNAVVGHGTMAASLIARVAPDAEIVPVRVLNADGVGSGLSVATGIRAAVSEGARVINMSLSSTTPSRSVTEAVAFAIASRATIVASAGNDDSGAKRYPAACPGVIAVASVDASGARSAFSNYGTHVSVCAPGEAIHGARYDGGFSRWNGTSFAAPFVAGQAVLLTRRFPEWTPAQIRARIRATTTRHGASNAAFSGLLGTGVVDIERSLR